MLTNYDVTAIIATCALLLSLAFWITLKKRWLPALKTDIIKEAPEIGKQTYDLIKEDLPDVKELFKKELPLVIAAFKKELPDLKTEIPLMMKEQAPKLIGSFLDDITKRVNDPKEEKLADLMCAMADSSLAVFRLRMRDPVFNKEVNDWINGKMTGVAAQFETRLPGILVKAAPEIKNAILSGGGGKEGEGDPMMQILGMFMPGGGKGGFPFG